MNKRETALEVIRIEYAKHGKETRESMRAYVENRRSGEARNEAVKRGLKIFKRDKFEEDEIRQLWENEKPITYNGKKYKVGQMSYGDYFLEPISWKGGETEGFSEDTLWLEKAKDNPYFYEVVKDE